MSPVPSEGGGTGMRETMIPSVDSRKPLGFLGVVFLLFFNVSGGPFGAETVISNCGPLIGLCTLAAFGLLYSVPHALVVAELTSCFPSNGGYGVWAQMAFGSFVGIQQSYWAWIAGVVDLSLYPVLLYSSVELILTPSLEVSVPDLPSANCWAGGVEPSGCWAYLIKLGMALAFTLPNVVSSRLAGRWLCAIGMLSLVPTIVFCLVAAPQMRWPNIARPPPSAVGLTAFGRLLMVVWWNLSGFSVNKASAVKGEVDTSHRMGGTVELVLDVIAIVAVYALPLLFGAAVDADWAAWQPGSLTHVAMVVGGTWLGVWMSVSALLSTWGMYTSGLFCCSFQLLGMAEVGMAPRLFMRRHRCTGTPLHSIALQLLLVACLITLDFPTILAVANFFSAASAVLEFPAALLLRRSEASWQRPRQRPYRVPVGTLGMGLSIVAPVAISLGACVVACMQSVESTALIGVGLVLGVVPYALVRFVNASSPFEELASRAHLERRLGHMEREDEVRSAVSEASREYHRHGVWNGEEANVGALGRVRAYFISTDSELFETISSHLQPSRTRSAPHLISSHLISHPPQGYVAADWAPSSPSADSVMCTPTEAQLDVPAPQQRLDVSLDERFGDGALAGAASMAPSGGESRVGHHGSQPATAADPSPRQRRRMLRQFAVCVLIAVFLYAQGGASILAPYFAGSPPGLIVGPHITGLIFAAYPTATALATPLPARTMRAWGTRTTVALGLMLTMLGNLGFGWLPRVSSSRATLAVGLALCRAMSGVGGQLAEAGALTTVAVQGWGHNLGKALSGMEVAGGMGSAIGAALGGALYEAGASLPFDDGQFMAPMIATVALGLLILPVVLAVLPSNLIGIPVPGRSATPFKRQTIRQALTFRRIVTIVSLLLCAMTFEGLNPIFEPHLNAPPFQLRESYIGCILSGTSLVYTLVALPTGYVTSRVLKEGKMAGRRLRSIMLCGWMSFALAALLLLVKPKYGFDPHFPLPPLTRLILAAPLLGIGCALCVVPSLPDLERGIAPGNDSGRARLCALWTGTYATGAAIGPLISSALFDAVGWDACMIFVAGLSAISAATLLTKNIARSLIRAPPPALPHNIVAEHQRPENTPAVHPP
jgi:amino acid transporter/MFS family permease